jgi:hypothetical protein
MIELPGQICAALRTSTGCVYAEVLRAPGTVDPVVVAGFANEELLVKAVADVGKMTFQLATDLDLRCPPLDVLSGQIETVLSAGPPPNKPLKLTVGRGRPPAA